MDPTLEQAFIREINCQCEFALAAYARMLESVALSMPLGVFCWVQSFLVAAANVSKIFQPSPAHRRPKQFKQQCQKRGEELRVRFGIDQASPILDRKLRDRFEHYDEDIQDWWSKGHNNIIDQNVVMNGTMQGAISTQNTGDMWRNFSSPPPQVVLGSQPFLLEPLEISLRAAMVQARKFLRPNEPASDAVVWPGSSGNIKVG